MVKRDRYGNSLTTGSAAAFDAYCEGVDLFLAAQAGGIELMQRACELDPGFALAHADVARASCYPRSGGWHKSKSAATCW